MRRLALAFIVACSSVEHVVAEDRAADPAALVEPPPGPPEGDGGLAPAPPSDAGPEVGNAGDVAAWAEYAIAAGAHNATLAPGASGNPRAGVVAGVAERAYDLAFDPSAMYTLTNPTHPDDQLDWNKLPGLSDCRRVDLAVDGLMFGWRWRIDVFPNVLEITAYANNAGVHLTPDMPLVSLDADDLASWTPLRYRLRMDGALYRFEISGNMRGRPIEVSTTLTRRCADIDPSTLFVQWAAGLYFGGTSVAPSPITARIFEWGG